ncbi:hypothetical protein [Kribbella lupini]|uniref:Uncharacterized protein n=1 Tax=Kribbella lupini TaxID=291602 RepID=A0ABN2BHA9_9ACTN
MDYATLRAEYDSLREQFLAGALNSAELVAMAVLVRARAAELPSAERSRLEGELDSLERLASYTPAPRSADASDEGSDALVDEASEVSRLARRADGSAAERLARAEAGLAKIRELAEGAESPRQRRAVLQYGEVLARLASALRDDGPGSA